MDPRKVAHWRYEQVERILDGSLTDHERHVLLRRLTRTPLRWPSGDERRISESTLYRWLRAYRAQGLRGLLPSPRKDRGKRRRVDRSAIEKAITLLREEPRRSLTMLLVLLRPFVKKTVPRSTLHRHLKAHPAYARLRRLARGDPDRALKRRFQASRAHQIWQCDAKGPFPVKLACGKAISVHVFTILDDFSRATLGWLVTTSPDLRSAIQVFRSAARRWGLPERFYADRASIFDAHAFRQGLAELGIHRVRSKPRNASARGKIEAYHRVLESWFVRELRHQIVQSIEHLQDLLTGVIEGIYLDHKHRGIQQTPREALGGCISPRQVSADRLLDAFLIHVRKKSHAKTGEVELGKGVFRVPAEFAGRYADFAYDLLDLRVAFLERNGAAHVPLLPAVHIAEEPKGSSTRGDGRLQALYDDVRGNARPQAEAGFGLPELFALFASHLARRIPIDEAEARLLQDFYRQHGPLGRAPTVAALAKVFTRLGADRPLAAYLSVLKSLIERPPDERKR